MYRSCASGCTCSRRRAVLRWLRANLLIAWLLRDDAQSSPEATGSSTDCWDCCAGACPCCSVGSGSSLQASNRPFLLISCTHTPLFRIHFAARQEEQAYSGYTASTFCRLSAHQACWFGDCDCLQGQGQSHCSLHHCEPELVAASHS